MQRTRNIRRRLFWVAAIFGLALVAGLALAPEPEGRSGVLRREVTRFFRPFYVAGTWLGHGISGIWHHYIGLTRVSAENDRLHTEVARLEEVLRIQAGVAAENSRLRALLSMAEPWTRHPIVARVIAANPQQDIRTVIIDRGWADGITRDRPVMAAGGFVGRVRVLTEHTATILLITDPSSAVDVLVTRSRVRGLLVGAIRGTELRRSVPLTQLEYVSQDSDIREGDELVTSGMDGVYPKGLPVGRVHHLTQDEFGLFEEAWVLPLADLSRLEEVVVL